MVDKILFFIFLRKNVNYLDIWFVLKSFLGLYGDVDVDGIVLVFFDFVRYLI